MKIISAIGLLVLVICLLNYGVDLFFYLKDLLCRYHIGRWDRARWEPAVERRAVCWLKKTPVVKITDNSRYVLLDMIAGKYRSRTIQSWQKAALILGLLESDRKDILSRAKEAAFALIDTDGGWKTKPARVDCGMLSYALLCAVDDPSRIRKAMDDSVSVIKESLNDEGMIVYTGEAGDPDIYVDTIGLCCPLLMRYAKIYQCPEYEETAFRQIRNYHQYGLLDGSALPSHAFSWKYKAPLGVYGWGRGTGWYVIGLVDSYENAGTEEYRLSIKQWIREAAESYKAYQRNDGGFGPIIQSTHGYDSSATAALAWFYAKCAGMFQDAAYREVSERCLQKLMKCTRTSGAIDWCQGDTKGIGIFSQTFDVMPFAQGMAVRAINLAQRG